MKRLSLLLACFFISMGLAIAQNKPVSGTVLDQSGEPVIGASVVVKGNATVGTVTDLDGKFTLSVPNSAETLVVKYLGMQDQEVAATADVNVTLKPSDNSLDEVIVVAYGTAKKSSFTGSAATIKSDALEKRKVSNVTKALDGLAPGVQVTSGNGQPGSGSSVYIRGLGSINAANTPLYVVDGIPYDGNISAISPNDIESITVLKDASAGALYGSRGANGVVLVTTKKGKSGVTEVNVKANFGVSGRAIPRYETMNSKEFIEANFSAFYNQQIGLGVNPADAGAVALTEMASGASKIFGLNEQYNPYNYPVAQLIDPLTGTIRSDATLLWDDDWLDEVTRNNAFRQEYTVDVSGGQEKAQYMLSFGYLDDNGILKTTNFQRYTGRLNLESKPMDWLALGLGSNFAQTKSNYLGATGSTTSNLWSSAMLMGPIFPIYQRDPSTGDFILDMDGNKQFDYGPNRPAANQGDFNSIATLYDDKYGNTINNLSARGHVDVGDTPNGWAKGLKFSVSLGFDYYGLNYLRYYNPYFGNAKNSKGRVLKENTTVFSYTANEMLSYKFDIEDLHHFDAMVAHEYYDLNIDVVGLTKTGFPFGGMYQPDAASTLTDGNGYLEDYRIESYLGRLNYDYDDKYYLSASLRSDASSRFPEDFRWETFWSVGGNYRISKEAFMEDYSDWLDNLAIRASYGIQGNDNLLTTRDGVSVSDFYPWQSLYDLSWANGNESGALVTSIENDKLSWERIATFNTGLDVSLWDSRLQVGLEYFHRKTNDLLLPYPLPLSSGFSSYNRNSGNMLNSGFELLLSGKIIKTQDLEWSATLMGSRIRNKVLKLTDDGEDILSGSYIIREGEPLYSLYVVRSAGVDPLNGDPLYWATVDANGDDVDPYITTSSVLANQSRYVAGSKYPDFYGSISTDLKYKAFDFSIATNYSYGGKMLDGVYNTLMSFGYAAQAKHKNLERAWKKPGDVTDLHRYEINGSYPVTDNQLIDASYFSIKNITLGYTLASKISKKAGIKTLRVYAAADNVAIFTHLKGTNPQYSINSGTDFVYAPTRTFSLGIDLKF